MKKIVEAVTPQELFFIYIYTPFLIHDNYMSRYYICCNFKGNYESKVHPFTLLTLWFTLRVICWNIKGLMRLNIGRSNAKLERTSHAEGRGSATQKLECWYLAWSRTVRDTRGEKKRFSLTQRLAENNRGEEGRDGKGRRLSCCGRKLKESEDKAREAEEKMSG